MTKREIQKLATARLPTPFGNFRMTVYRLKGSRREHIVLSLGELKGDKPVLARLHSECITGEIFGSLRCDCGPQLRMAMERIADEGKGIIVYLRQEGRGIGLVNKLKAYRLQDEGHDTVEANRLLGFKADLRDYDMAAGMLRREGVGRVRLLTNNPDKIEKLQKCGIEVAERVSLEIEPDGETGDYLRTKKDKMGHLLDRV